MALDVEPATKEALGLLHSALRLTLWQRNSERGFLALNANGNQAMLLVSLLLPLRLLQHFLSRMSVVCSMAGRSWLEAIWLLERREWNVKASAATSLQNIPLALPPGRAAALGRNRPPTYCVLCIQQKMMQRRMGLKWLHKLSCHGWASVQGIPLSREEIAGFFQLDAWNNFLRVVARNQQKYTKVKKYGARCPSALLTGAKTHLGPR